MKNEVRKPSSEQIAVAAEWLDINEGTNGEADACRAVATWIKHIQAEADLRAAARAAGVTTARARRMIYGASAK